MINLGKAIDETGRDFPPKKDREPHTLYVDEVTNELLITDSVRNLYTITASTLFDVLAYPGHNEPVTTDLNVSNMIKAGVISSLEDAMSHVFLRVGEGAGVSRDQANMTVPQDIVFNAVPPATDEVVALDATFEPIDARLGTYLVKMRYYCNIGWPVDFHVNPPGVVTNNALEEIAYNEVDETGKILTVAIYCNDSTRISNGNITAQINLQTHPNPALATSPEYTIPVPFDKSSDKMPVMKISPDGKYVELAISEAIPRDHSTPWPGTITDSASFVHDATTRIMKLSWPGQYYGEDKRTHIFDVSNMPNGKIDFSLTPIEKGFGEQEAIKWYQNHTGSVVKKAVGFNLSESVQFSSSTMGLWFFDLTTDLPANEEVEVCYYFDSTVASTKALLWEGQSLNYVPYTLNAESKLVGLPVHLIANVGNTNVDLVIGIRTKSGEVSFVTIEITLESYPSSEVFGNTYWARDIDGKAYIRFLTAGDFMPESTKVNIVNTDGSLGPDLPLDTSKVNNGQGLTKVDLGEYPGMSSHHFKVRFEFTFTTGFKFTVDREIFLGSLDWWEDDPTYTIGNSF